MEVKVPTTIVNFVHRSRGGEGSEGRGEARGEKMRGERRIEGRGEVRGEEKRGVKK